MPDIQELIYSVSMLELGVKMLKRQIEELAAAATSVEDNAIRCPDCGIELPESSQYNTMGAVHQQYACPNCPFRGEIADG